MISAQTTRTKCFKCLAYLLVQVVLLLQNSLSLAKCPTSVTCPPSEVNNNLFVLVSEILTEFFTSLAPFSKLVPKHIFHKYSSQMSKKSNVVVLDVLMKNETKHKDMLEIMTTLQEYLGESYPDDRPVLSGGDQLTCERQVGAQRHMMCGNTARERLELLKPVVEDWHCLVAFIGVSVNVYFIHTQCMLILYKVIYKFTSTYIYSDDVYMCTILNSIVYMYTVYFYYLMRCSLGIYGGRLNMASHPGTMGHFLFSEVV